MSKLKMILAAAACALPFAIFAAPASAASAHNLQHGTSTKNSNDTRMSAMMKQHHMRRMHRHRHHYRHHHMRTM